MAIIKFVKSKYFWLAFIFVIFLLARIHGLGFPYYQDENHWPGVGSAGLAGLENAPHPPLTGISFIVGVGLFGPDNLRFLPFAFAIINFWLLFIFVKNRFSWNRALWSLLFFGAGFYSILASLMVDTDGQILPFFFLLSVLFYYKWRDDVILRNKIIWGCLLAVSIFLGFMTKASFVIAFGAIVLDFLYSRKQFLSRQKIIKIGLIVLGVFALLAALIVSIMYLLSSNALTQSITYWKHFIVFSNRNYLQVFIQFLKALLYVSPLLVAPILLLKKDVFKKLSLFIFFLVLGLIFYLILFDFSSGALDRYFQFIIVPLSIISGVVVGNIFESSETYRRKKFVLLGCGAGLILFLIQFLPHYVPALYPKTDWFNRVFQLKWNFLFPFTGGSGPMGFYVSWLFMGIAWLAVIILGILAARKKSWQKPAWTVILIIGFLYNGIFIEEYLFGKINGSSTVLMKNLLSYVKSSNNIPSVITYNNIGLAELSKMGKYKRRLYVAPKHEKGYIAVLNSFKSYYMVLEIPKIDPQSIYGRYFKSCVVVYEEFSGSIPARIYDCKNSINI